MMASALNTASLKNVLFCLEKNNRPERSSKREANVPVKTVEEMPAIPSCLAAVVCIPMAILKRIIRMYTGTKAEDIERQENTNKMNASIARAFVTADGQNVFSAFPTMIVEIITPNMKPISAVRE